jgi:hypothetical protein
MPIVVLPVRCFYLERRAAVQNKPELGLLDGSTSKLTSLGSAAPGVVKRVWVMRDSIATAPCAASIDTPRDRAVTRCISIADASLSLSLSLGRIG